MFTIPILSSVFLIAVATAKLWHAVPLVLVVSLVYGATRHEHLKDILVHAMRSFIWVVGFMGLIFGVIWLAGFWN